MHLRGIHYDVGTETLDGSLTRPILTDEEIERDIGDIAAGLHGNAIRITGGEIGRLASAGEVAVRRGLEVWLSPMVPNADNATTLARVAETAQVAEELRGRGHAVVVVNQRFLDEVDPGRCLPERERLRRADAARRAYFTRLAYLSPRKRRGASR